MDGVQHLNLHPPAHQLSQTCFANPRVYANSWHLAPVKHSSTAGQAAQLRVVQEQAPARYFG